MTDTLTVYLNGQAFDVSREITHPHDLLAAGNYDPDDFILYPTLDDVDDVDGDSPIEEAPVGFDDGDEFTVIPRETVYDDRELKYHEEAKEIAADEDRELVDSLDTGYEYEKLPKTIEARRLDTDAVIPTLEGVMRVEAGNWVVRGVKGEVYSVEDEIFRETYQPVTDAAEHHYYHE